MPEAPEVDDPYEQLEAEAAELIDALPDDGDSAKPLLNKLRKQLAGQARKVAEAEKAGYQRALAEVKREAVLASHGLPPSLRRLVADVGAEDSEALTARLEALRAEGLSWKRPDGAQPPISAGEQPDSDPAPAPDPGQIVGQFQQAQAAGKPGQAGDVLSRVAQGGVGAISDASDLAQFEGQLNQQIGALGQQARAGQMG